MSIFDGFPLMNAYSVNLDWIIKKVRDVEKYVQDYTAVNKVAYAGVWDITKQYPQWALVTDGDTSWLSNKPVPVGIPLENSEYWQKLADLDPRIAGIIVELDSIQWHFLNVQHYGAVGDGVVDDYKAFKTAYDAAKNGQGIYIPFGTYNLSDNPDDGKKAIKWIADIGVKITGAGLGHPESGAGGFMCTTISNPWLVVSGDNLRYNLNNIPCPEGGAIMGDAKELMNMDAGTDRRWYSLEYRGGETGTKDSDLRNVELLNQVLNVTGFAGIVQEIDLNMYAKPNRWSSAILLTGRGQGGGDMSAIDITRDEGEQKWSTAISVRRANTGLYIDNAEVDYGIIFGAVPRSANAGLGIQQKNNGSDCIVLRRKTNDNPSGNFLVCWDETNKQELFAIGIDGSIRGSGIPSGPSIVRQTYTVDATGNVNEYTVNMNRPEGKSILAVVETASLGFVSPVWVTESTNEAVKVYAQTPGSGTIRFAVLWQ